MVVSIYGSKEGEQHHAWILLGEEKLKIVWKTRLWFQVIAWINGIEGLRHLVTE